MRKALPKKESRRIKLSSCRYQRLRLRNAEAENERVLMFGAWGSGASCVGLANPLVDGVVVD